MALGSLRYQVKADPNLPWQMVLMRTDKRSLTFSGYRRLQMINVAAASVINNIGYTVNGSVTMKRLHDLTSTMT